MSGLILFAADVPENLSIFDPVSPPGHSIVQMAIFVLAVTGVIALIVEGALIYSILKFRRTEAARPDASKEPPQVYGSHPIEIAWTAAPTLIVFVLILVIARTEWETRPKIAPFEKGRKDNALYVTVYGRQWWWEYRYEGYNGETLGFVTANELHVPQGSEDTPRPVYLTLKSADVCHSWWVPRLGGKTDVIPGKTNQMWFQTNEKGLYLGQCAEYCGTQHAKMLLRVYVDPPDEFAKWLDDQKQDAITPKDEKVIAGRDVYLKTSCVDCHRVGGTGSKGNYAPDLTHLMSRQTLASGIIPNNKKNLRDWIADPRKIKPGCLMAGFGLMGEADLDAITEYLHTLK